MASRERDNNRRGLRIPPNVYGAVKRLAERERRSMAKQLEVIVEQWLQEHEPQELNA